MNSLRGDMLQASGTTPNGHRQQPSRVLKVLHVTGTLRRGGIETWLRHALVRLPRDRYQSDVCIYQFERGAYADELENYGCGVHFIPRGSNPAAILKFSNEFRNFLREGRYDIVHCHGLLLVGFILFLARLERVPVRIGHAHSTDRRTGTVFALAAKRIGLTLNRMLARAFSTYGIGCSAEAEAALFGKRSPKESKYSVIHCGVNLAPFEAEPDHIPWRETLGIPKGALVMGHVSNFGVAKNPGFLVEMAASIFQRRKDVILLLVGDSAERPSVEKKCADLGISSRVIFAGTSDRVPELMCFAMDVFVMPSVHEGLPLVLLEAQAAGLPCLVSDVVSREAAVMHEALHFMPLAAGPEAWGTAVLSLLDLSRRPSILPVMKDTDFNIDVSAKRLADLYDTACSSNLDPA